jgi:hypothetical protein
MFFFGHIGITVGVAKACELYFTRRREKVSDSFVSQAEIPDDGREKFRAGTDEPIPFRIDYRIVIIGSILPDLIDKPLFLLLGDSFALSGRDYAHTLLFFFLLLTGGILLLKMRTLMAAGSGFIRLMHLLLDTIMECAGYPLLAVLGPIRGSTVSGWIGDRWYSIFTEPAVYVPEIIGLVILSIFFIRLVRHRRILAFVGKGILN